MRKTLAIHHSLITKLLVWLCAHALGLSLACQTPAQAQSKEAFERIFSRETQSLGRVSTLPQFRHIKQLSYMPDTLPAWFFAPPPSTGQAIHAIGISDPDLPPDLAAQQALHRALLKGILLHSCTIQYFRDSYTSAQELEGDVTVRQRYDTYFRLTSEGISSSCSYSVVEHHFTRYHEAVVLLRYAPKASLQPYNEVKAAEATVLYVEAQVDDAFEPQAEFGMQSTRRIDADDEIDSRFRRIERGMRSLSVSEFQGEEIEFPIYTYQYTNPLMPPYTPPLVSNHGLWSLFISDFLQQVSVTTEQSTLRIRSLGQHSNPEIANLSREIASFNARITLNGIVFGRDSIGFNLHIHELGE